MMDMTVVREKMFSAEHAVAWSRSIGVRLVAITRRRLDQIHDCGRTLGSAQ